MTVIDKKKSYGFENQDVGNLRVVFMGTPSFAVPIL